MRRISILGASIVVLALGAATSQASTSAAKASASCGTEHTEGGAAHIIAQGVSCARARKVIHDFATKGAFWHFVGTNHANGYSPVDGWRCTLFMGHSDCKRGHAVIRAEPLPPGHAAVALAGTGGASATSASVHGRPPPCAQRALTAGLRRGKLRGRIDGHAWACAGRFAYAVILVDAGGGVRDAVTVLFRASTAGWEVVSRGKYCENGSVPVRIRRIACESN